MRRRSFLVWLGALAGVVVGVPLAVRSWRGRRALPDLSGSAPVGQASLIATLIAVADVVIGMPCEQSHYTEFFRFRIERVRGYGALYARLHADLDAAARARGHDAFASCTGAVRTQIVREAARMSAPLPDARSLLTTPLDPPAADAAARIRQYERFVAQEILCLFEATDAWVSLGYEAWPGVPLGADYSQAPTARR